MVSDWSENDWTLRPVVSDWSGGVGMVCGMKRGISEVDLSRGEFKSVTRHEQIWALLSFMWVVPDADH